MGEQLNIKDLEDVEASKIEISDNLYFRYNEEVGWIALFGHDGIRSRGIIIDHNDIDLLVVGLTRLIARIEARDIVLRELDRWGLSD